MIRKSGNRFSLATNAYAFARRSCSNNKLKRDGVSIRNDRALGMALPQAPPPRPARPCGMTADLRNSQKYKFRVVIGPPFQFFKACRRLESREAGFLDNQQRAR